MGLLSADGGDALGVRHGGGEEGDGAQGVGVGHASHMGRRVLLADEMPRRM